MSSHYKVNHSVVEASYAALYAQYTELVDLRGKVAAQAGQLVPKTASPHMTKVYEAMSVTQDAARINLINEIIAVETRLVDVLRAVHTAVTTFGVSDGDAAASLGKAMSEAPAAIAGLRTMAAAQEAERRRMTGGQVRFS